MTTQTFFQKMSDGTEVSVSRWIPDDGTEVKGAVHLSHGMTEHSMRYDRLGSVMAENGWIFSAHDHRGHGRTAQKAEADGTGMFGFLAEKDGFNRAVSDIDEAIQKLKADFPGKKAFLLGHSFGSFLAQSYIERFGGNVDGCVLCGTAGPGGLKIRAGLALSKIVRALKGARRCSPFLNKMAFGSYCKRIKDSANGREWLTRDKDCVQMYIDDKWCGFVPTTQFFCDLLSGLVQIHKSANVSRVPKNLPVLLIYGTEDPVGGYGKTVKKLAEIYKARGMADVTEKAYDGARHELFNETNKDAVTADVIDWLGSRL